MEDNKNIDDLFKKGLGDYTEVPPPAVWDALEKRLDGKQKRRGFFYPWFISLLLLSFISLLGGTIWKLSDHSTSVAKSAASLNQASITIPQNSDTKTNITKTIPQENNNLNHSIDIAEQQSGNTLKDTKTNKAKEQHRDMPEIATTNEDLNKQNAAEDTKSTAGNDIANGTKPVKAANAEPGNNIAKNENKPLESDDRLNEKKTAIAEQGTNGKEIADNTIAGAPKGLVKAGEKQLNAYQALNKDNVKNTVPEKQGVPLNNKINNAVTDETIASKGSALSGGKKTAIHEESNTKQAYKENSVAKKNIINKRHRSAEASSAEVPATTKILPAANVNPSIIAGAKTTKQALKPVSPAINTAPTPDKTQAVNRGTAKEKELAGTSNITADKGETLADRQVVDNAFKNREFVSLTKIAPGQFSFEKEYANNIPKAPAKEARFESREMVFNDVKEEVPSGTFKGDAVVVSETNNLKGTTINNAIGGESITRIISNRFEAGVKAGYEGSFNNMGTQKFVGAFYLQYNLNEKFAVMLQPAVKTTHVNYQKINGVQTFYKENNDSAYTVAPVIPITIINNEGQPVTTAYTQTYTFSQTHDSIVKSYGYGGTSLEIELPVLLKYNISSKLSVYGGMNIIYSRTFGLSENTYTSAGIYRKTDTLNWWPFGGPVPAPPSASSVLKYSGAPISSYTGPLYPSQTDNLLRVGYMLGFSYEFRKRWLFDVLVQQGSARQNVQGNYDINKPFTLPYFRVMLGYKLGKISLPFLK